MLTTASWRVIQRQNFTSMTKLAEFLQLDELQKQILLEKPKFILNLPLRLAQKITKNNPNDPLFIQFVATKQELIKSLDFQVDPVCDKEFSKTSKLLKKYQNRALILSTSACAMHCRYCFRQNFPYDVSQNSFDDELKECRADTSIEEIILSGGDPLSLDNKVLKNLLNSLDQIPHIQRIRFHTRFPIGIPERIDDEFLQILDSSSKQLIFVVHINHPNELDVDILKKLKAISKLGIPIYNQSVLLKDVNDSIDTLEDLLNLLINNGITPYYLHQLDKVQGAEHFQVEKSKGLQIIKELRKRLPGYAIPEYVQEIAHEPHKTPLS